MLQTVPTVDVERLQCEGHTHRALTTIGRRANDADKFPVSILPRKSISISPSAGHTMAVMQLLPSERKIYRREA